MFFNRGGAATTVVAFLLAEYIGMIKKQQVIIQRP